MRRKISTYWLSQIVGWLVVGGAVILYAAIYKVNQVIVIWRAIILISLGLGVSHIMRLTIIRLKILHKRFGTQAAWLLLIAIGFSLLLSFCFDSINLRFNLEVSAINQNNHLFRILGMTLNTAPFIILWNLIYFLYHYIEKIREQQGEILKRERLTHELEVQKLENEKANAELLRQSTEMKMHSLRAQMNPHFIFNSLNAINRFILQSNKVQASEYLTKFSRLIRIILQNSQETLIPVESELQALQLYLEMEALRFDDQFEYKIQVNDDIDVSMTKVPPLFIQPYAENAIWHGLMHKEVKGRLEIELFAEGDMLCCRIMDDGVGRKKAAELKSKSAYSYKSMGMNITANRIAMLQQQTQSKSSIQVTDLTLPDGGAGGTEVFIKLPLHYD